MGIRAEKRKVLQQIVNNEDSSLPLDPEPLMAPTDLHWFQAVAPKPKSDEAENEEGESPAIEKTDT